MAFRVNRGVAMRRVRVVHEQRHDDDAEQRAELPLNPARKAYVHLIRGELQVNGQALKGGDAALMQAETNLELTHGVDAEVLVFDLASQ